LTIQNRDGDKRFESGKYVTKDGAWWNVNLLGQRHPGNQNFRLA
jgi:hypothetical protein